MTFLVHYTNIEARKRDNESLIFNSIADSIATATLKKRIQCSVG